MIRYIMHEKTMRKKSAYLPWSEQTFEKMGISHRHHNSLFHQALCLFKTGYAVPGHVWIFQIYVSLYVFRKLPAKDTRNGAELPYHRFTSNSFNIHFPRTEVLNCRTLAEASKVAVHSLREALRKHLWTAVQLEQQLSAVPRIAELAM